MKQLDCPITNTCAGTRCKEKVPLPKCWADVDCIGGTCAGAIICPCDQTCFSPDMPGECKF
ncbi:hypothetical protein E8A74_02000 [Polyangium fumosum]|uniref:Uncharacterized protein n=2 Tax=Polyangium fumosum TaxID=889272 RepID=A0A4U1JKN8_9BACT|nr:hypothetical protein E8A74_02000 [Polyangium fumosum]